MGQFTAFLASGVVLIILSIFTAIYLPETKGKTLEEIQALFGNSEIDQSIEDLTMQAWA